MTTARFPVSGSLDSSNGRAKGTVEIDREEGMFRVRPLRRRRTYDMPLSSVADLVVRTIVEYELLQKKRERSTRKKARR